MIKRFIAKNIIILCVSFDTLLILPVDEAYLKIRKHVFKLNIQNFSFYMNKCDEKLCMNGEKNCVI